MTEATREKFLLARVAELEALARDSDLKFAVQNLALRGLMKAVFATDRDGLRFDDAKKVAIMHGGAALDEMPARAKAAEMLIEIVVAHQDCPGLIAQEAKIAIREWLGR